MQFRPATRRSQIVRLSVCLMVLFAGTAISLRQLAPPQFAPEPKVGSWKWWLTPQEKNIAFRPALTRANLVSVFFIPSQTQLGWAVGGDGTILHTEDGGRSWHIQPSASREIPLSVTFVTPQLGWAVGFNGTILHTEDGGRSWNTQSSGSREHLLSVSFATPQLGWAAGRNGTILHTEDRGRSWQPQSSGSPKHLSSITFATSQSGWAVGDSGTILHTEDGGRNWQPQSNDSHEILWSITFATSQSGWAVGGSGTILHTEDGGRSWQPQSSGSYHLLSSITFVTSQLGWAVGESGTILHTEDGGRSWQPQSSGFREDLNAMTFATPQSGWAVGKNGTILHSEDGGRSWEAQSSGSRGDLTSITFATQQSGWAVGSFGTILHTQDGGRSWQPQSSGSYNDLTSVTFATPRSGWAVGWFGTILHTEDGGRSWEPQSSGFEHYPTSVTFATPQLGWAVGWIGTIIHTEDGGRSWQDQGRSFVNLLAVTFATPQSGWAVGPRGTILHTEDGGQNWRNQSSHSSEILECVTFATPELGWVVGDNGTILHTADGGRNWQSQMSGSTEPLYSVTFASTRLGWAVGGRGTILHTEDGGQSWTNQSSDSGKDLTSVTFVTPQLGWTVGLSRTVLHTEDGGKSWNAVGQYRRWPAPWFYMAIVSCIAGLFWASLTVPVTNFQHIEDVANSDNPVTLLKGDLLGYRSMVLRILRFIQNPNTAPPLVLLIQAPWGMGKSSAMRMLQSELKDKRAAATVWFNAWHHQKEDQLLAYLLEAIQKQVAPSWLSAVGIGFRFNLLRVRMFANIERFLGTLVALGALIFHSTIAEFLSAKITRWVGAERSHSLSLLVVLSIGIGILLNQIRAFNADPQKLLESSTKSVWRFLRDLFVFPSLQGKTDVRQEFEKNLQEVTNALRPQRLVIFLDDLDRCRPEQVVQILEAINFLSSAAPCFIIVGADYGKVETLVGMSFEHLAVQEKENAGIDKPDTAKTRLDYARSYMRKVVNIRLNLPRPDPEAWKRLLGQPAERVSNTAMHWQQGLLAAVLILCVSAVVATGMGWIAIAPKEQVTDVGATLPVKEISSENPRDVRPGQSPSQPGGRGGQPSEKTPPTTQVSGVEDRNHVGTLWSNRLTIGAASLIALIFMVIVFRRPKEVEKAVDSKEFVETLQQMAEQVYKRNDTPREMRRFLNYLRLVAAPDDPGKGKHAGEAGLVRLAAKGLYDSQEEESIVELFQQRCDMFGLDPQTFTPKDEREKALAAITA